MRPLRFPQVALNSGLATGSAVAQGLNQAMANYMKMKMQKTQMANQAAQIQAMAGYRNSQSQLNQSKAAGTSLADIQLLQAVAKGGHLDPAVIRPAMKDRVQTFLDNAPLDQKVALTKHINDQMDAGKIPDEVSNQVNFEPNTMNLFKAAGQQNSMENRTQAIQAGMTARTQAVQQGQAARTASMASNRLSPAQKGDMESMNNYTSQMKQIHQNMMGLDKVGPTGMPLYDDATKQRMQESYQSDLSDLNEKYSQAQSRVTGQQRSMSFPGSPQASKSGQPSQTGVPPLLAPNLSSGNQQQGQSPAPQIISADKWTQANPGQIVAHPTGQGYLVRAPGTHQDGSPNFSPVYSTPQAAAAAIPTIMGGASAPASAAPVPAAPVPSAPAAGGP